MTLYARVARPALFRLDPERAHELAIASAARGAPIAGVVAGRAPADGRLARELWGLRFPTPIGLAAGFDKSARALSAWARMGFGFVEAGSVTAVPQPGNPRPRIFRLSEDGALINRLGFNNDGAAVVAERIARWRGGGGPHVPLGVNIGKSRDVGLEDAADDYAASLERLWTGADYVVVNVSSPNTPGLRRLQDAASLRVILERMLSVDAAKAAASGDERRPLLVKLSPDLGAEAADQVVDLALELGLAGLVISNTTLARDGLAAPAELAAHEGGLSGRPLRDRSTDMVRRARARAGDRLCIIGVGGVFNADDAWQKLAAGADLVQIYTGLIYGGPGTARRIARGILQRMDREGRTTLRG